MRKQRFVLPKGCSIESVTLREIDGKDEEQAAGAAEARGMKPGQVTEEMVRCALVEVNDTAVVYPHPGLSKWNTKTRNLVIAAFASMNSTEDKDMKSFLEEAEDCGEWVRPDGKHAKTSSEPGLE